MRSSPEILRQGLLETLPGLLAQSEGRGGGGGDQVRIGQPGEIDQEHSIGERLERLRRSPHPQPRLANPTRVR